MSKYERHQKTAAEQHKQQLVNCVLLLAYVHGQPGGWYCIAGGHIDGFRSDYAIVHSEPGNLECHPLRVIVLSEATDAVEYADELKVILDDQEAKGNARPLVTTVTEEEMQATLKAVREALQEEQPEDVEAWLRNLCSLSDLSYCDWDAVIGAIKG